jgi:hypothetical protein
MNNKQRRKSNHCLNCGLRVESIYNYCPQCGQENTNNKVSVLELLRDIYDDYITFDSRLFRSLKPFFLAPGKLTNTFNEGQRITYVHPVRFYLLISLLYFFVFTHVFDMETLPLDLDKKINQVDSLDKVSNKKSLYYDSSVLKEIKNTNELFVVADAKAKQTERVKTLLKINKKIKKLETALAKEKTEEAADTVNHKAYTEKLAYLQKLLASLEKNPAMVITADSVDAKMEEIEEIYTQNDPDNQGFSIKFKKLLALLQDKNTTEEKLLDSLNVKERTPLITKFAHQLLKIGRNDLSIFLQAMVDNIPIMMTLLLPLMALLLKLIYVRANRLYIEHLVFAFHVQSFVYLGLIIGFLLYYFLNYQYPVELVTYSTLILSVYIVLMFKNVYKQGWLKTTLKAVLLSWAYSIVLIIFLVAEILVSFFLY